MKKTITYRTYEDDVVSLKDNSAELPKDYVFVHEDKGWNLASDMLYPLFKLGGALYLRASLRARVKNNQGLKSERRGCFLYANHTQPLGDVFLPALAVGRRRIYTIANPVNLKVPVLGRFLPLIGILPIPGNLSQMRDFVAAIEKRLSQGHVIIVYPEAHVWPYYTGIRPFSDDAFGFPADFNAPVYTMTSTYQKRAFGRKPKLTAYVDGPFLPDESLRKKARRKKLRDQAFDQMEKRNLASTYDYVLYKKE